MKKLALSLVFAFSLHSAFPQVNLSYYLPDGISYNPAIPTPASIIGHEVGEWHVSHDRLVNYLYALDKASDRISLEVTGQTFESRPLLLLTITSPKNQQNIQAIRLQHLPHPWSPLLHFPYKNRVDNSKVLRAFRSPPLMSSA